ncbi:indoleacetic acid-induced protein 8 [Actinidia rufa]|uniref:Auxin-responsive protein n=1 Tax=Actinidia rufa TaxID=165716 RepID=A0A7J0FZQ9_9ERIC|nr:indoleacetic acid-induced protein 8 [Actinidia rufa]
MSPPLVHDYIGLSEASSSSDKLSSSSSSSSSSTEDEKKSNNIDLNLKETELRLGLPGSKAPERKAGLVLSLFGNDLEDKPNGFKSFDDLGKSGNLFSPRSGKNGLMESNTTTQPSSCLAGPSVREVVPPSKSVQEKKTQVSTSNQHGSAPAAKAQVVGWPPIRSFRKNTMATNSTKSVDDDGKSGSGCLYVKVSMDGAPYLRKVDLKTYSNYMEISSALEKMFSCFTIGPCSSQGLPGRDGLSESHLMDLLHGSEYVLTYEDKDGDWMLVGDVPWEMFTNSCKRLRIMKGSEAIGLAPRAMEKCKNRN